MRTCAKCGFPLADEATICGRCGQLTSRGRGLPPVVWLSRKTDGNIVTIKMVPPPEKMLPY